MNGVAARCGAALLPGLLLLGLAACHRAPPAGTDLTLARADARPPLLRVTAGHATLRAQDVPAGTAWRVDCDTATGPLTREGRSAGGVLGQTVPLPAGGVYGCAAQVGDARATAAPSTPAPALKRVPKPLPPARPAPPSSGTLTVTPATVRIGRREPWTVRAALLDASGAPVPDGTLVTLTGRGPGGADVVAGRVTVNGEATWTLMPDQPGAWTLDARSGRWHAQGRASARSALLGGVPPLLWAGESLKVGPLTWDDGALPDDGTPVEVQALDAAGGTVWSARAFTVLGRVELDVPQVRAARTLRLVVAGAAVSLPWARP